MSFFTSTHTVVTRRSIPATINRATTLALLHDHDTFTKLQPLVVENTIIDCPDPAGWLATETTANSPPGVMPKYRTVTERISLWPFGTRNIVILSGFCSTEDGLVTVFQAPLGLCGKNLCRVISAKDGQGLVLVEESELTGLALYMPFVMKTFKTAHEELMDRFIQKLEGKL